MIKFALGVDIGGTKTSVIVGSERGQIYSFNEIPTLTGRRTNECHRHLIRTLKSLIAKYKNQNRKFIGIGVGIPGPVDSKHGIVPRSPHLPGWKGIPLAKILQQHTGLPVVMANDANAAAVGEKYFGKGKSKSDFLYITVSTGIGGGIIIQKRLLEGHAFVAGEIGHMAIVAGGRECKCGRKGCLEIYASGTAMADYAAAELRKGRKSIIPQFLQPGEKISARILGKAAKKGDKLALESYENGAYYLGIGMANLLNILNPERIILGGGVFKSAPRNFWTEMIKSCKDQAWPEAFKSADIVRSGLGDRVGNMGAMALAFDKLNHR